MNAGIYREIVTIEKNRYEPDSLGNQTETWETYYRAFVYVNNLSGTEYWTAAQTESENTVMFTLRFHPLLSKVTTKGFRLTFRGHEYNIRSIDNVKYKNETIKIRAVAKEGV